MTIAAGVIVRTVALLDTVWECELAAAIWKSVRFLQKLEIELFGGQGIYQKDFISYHKDTLQPCSLRVHSQ